MPNILWAQEIIGAVTAVKNQVYVTHSGKDEKPLVYQGDDVIFSDTYETGIGASVKFLFKDDSLITLGENSRIRISKNIYKPKKKQRSTVLDLLSGSARVLVGKTFSGAESKFEIHTPNAIAAARGTYFIVKFDASEMLSEIVNLSRTSIVDISRTDPAQSDKIQLKPNQIGLIKAGQSIRVLSHDDPQFMIRQKAAISRTHMKETAHRSPRQSSIPHPSSNQVKRFESRLNRKAQTGKGQERGPASKGPQKSPAGRRMLEGFKPKPTQRGRGPIPHQSQQLPPPPQSAGSASSSPITLELNFQ